MYYIGLCVAVLLRITAVRTAHDNLDDILRQNPALRQQYEKKENESIIAVSERTYNETWALANKTFEDAMEYTQFQCAVKDGLQSLDELHFQVTQFESSIDYQRAAYSHELWFVMRKTIRRLVPPDKEKVAVYYAGRLLDFLIYSPSEVACTIRKSFLNNTSSSLELEYELAEVAGTGPGLYYLFSSYIHPNKTTKVATPAVRTYLRLKGLGERVSLFELLKRYNHWPMTLRDLRTLNLFRRSLTSLYSIDHVKISGDSENPIIMPKTNLDHYFCRQ